MHEENWTSSRLKANCIYPVLAQRTNQAKNIYNPDIQCNKDTNMNKK